MFEFLDSFLVQFASLLLGNPEAAACPVWQQPAIWSSVCDSTPIPYRAMITSLSLSSSTSKHGFPKLDRIYSRWLLVIIKDNSQKVIEAHVSPLWEVAKGTKYFGASIRKKDVLRKTNRSAVRIPIDDCSEYTYLRESGQDRVIPKNFFSRARPEERGIFSGKLSNANG